MTETIAREVFDLLFEASLEAVFIVDRTTEKVVSANLAADDMLRREVGGLVGLTLDQLMFEGRDVRAPGRYEEVALRGGDDYPVYVELNVTHVAARDRHNLGSGHDLDDFVGDLAAYTARDTSGHRSMQRELIAKHAALFCTQAELERTRLLVVDLRAQLDARDREQARQRAGAGRGAGPLMRQATMGALTAGLLHDLASTMQALNAALSEIAVHGGQIPEIRDAVTDANAAGDEAVQLFVQMRKFIRDGEVKIKPMAVTRLVERAVKLAGGYVRERAQLRVSELPRAEVAVAEAMVLQVLANLLRNAANASPRHGVVDLRVSATATDVTFTVIDDGPGVPDAIAATMFEPFDGDAGETHGVGLAIAAYVMHQLGGTIRYARDATRGASFSATIPLAAPARN